jgi:TolB-like protein/DNA-binding winged helix-turn-helix (wHTH) protein/Flp pilus assembly protein TadD
MSVSMLPLARILRFGPFELDMYAGELRKSGLKLRLQGQPIQVLAILLQSAGDLVTREEIRSRLWENDTFVDFDHALHNAIARIRDVLGDSAQTPIYIETLPRRGYRFIASVEAVQPLEEAETSTSDGSEDNGENPHEPIALLVPPENALPSKPVSNRRRLILASVACGMMALAAVFVFPYLQGRIGARPLRSIAVLPLKNFSGDPAQEYFADGMTDELITEMSRIQPLRVVSHTSVMEYKGTRKHLPQIARELGVDSIVEGSVLREGDQIRITVQLLDGTSDRHLWSEDYQRPLQNILNLQRDIAQAIAQQVRVKLDSPEQARIGSARPVKPRAYEAYLRGRYYLVTQFSMLQPLNTARSYFTESIRNDPDFASAYVGLADAYIDLALFTHFEPQAALGPARQALHKALALDASDGEAHKTLSLLRWRFEWDWAAAERELKYAIALTPGSDCAHAYYALFLACRNRREQALAELTRSRELNPGSSFSTTESAVYFQLRDYPHLIEASRKGVASDPGEWLEHYFLGVGYEGAGNLPEAILEYRKAVEMSHADQNALAALAYAYAVSGSRSEAQTILADLQQRSKSTYISPYFLAAINAGLGQKDAALASLEKLHGEKSPDLIWHINSDLRLDNLRSDPRFQVLLRQAGFPL